MIFSAKNSAVRQYTFVTHNEMMQFIGNLDPSRSKTRLVNEEVAGNLFCVYKVVDSIDDSVEKIIAFSTEFNQSRFIISYWNNSIIFDCGESCVIFSKTNNFFSSYQVSTQITSISELGDGRLLLMEEAGYRIYSRAYLIVENTNTGFVHRVEAIDGCIKISADNGDFLIKNK